MVDQFVLPGLLRSEMRTRGYAVEITNLSPNATEKDVNDFLAFCGAIQHVELVRYSPGY